MVSSFCVEGAETSEFPSRRQVDLMSLLRLCLLNSWTKWAEYCGIQKHFLF